MCLALVVGNMIGSGIFLLPANLAPYGLNAIWGWVITIGGAHVPRDGVRRTGQGDAGSRRPL